MSFDHARILATIYGACEFTVAASQTGDFQVWVAAILGGCRVGS